MQVSSGRKAKLSGAPRLSALPASMTAGKSLPQYRTVRDPLLRPPGLTADPLPVSCDPNSGGRPKCVACVANEWPAALQASTLTVYLAEVPAPETRRITAF